MAHVQYYSAFQVELATARAHTYVYCTTYERRAATSLYENVGSKEALWIRDTRHCAQWLVAQRTPTTHRLPAKCEMYNNKKIGMFTIF